MKKIFARLLKFIFMTLLLFLLAGLFYIFSIYKGELKPLSVDLSVQMKLPPFPKRAAKKVKIHFLKSAFGETPVGTTISGGDFTKTFDLVYGGILVQHNKKSLLIDTGLGREVDAQVDADMPFISQLLLQYEKKTPIIDQINASKNLPYPDRIFLTHAHWDHASGISDFRDLPIWVTSKEMNFIKSSKAPEVLPSQVHDPKTRWHIFSLENKKYAGFDKSLDLFGDKTVVIVGLFGHTPGSIGIFVNTKNKRYFFIGDTVWNIDSIRSLKKRFILSAKLADHNEQDNNQMIRKLYSLLKNNPELQIIPAHDLRTWE